MIQIKLVAVVVALSVVSQALGSAIKGLEHPPTKGASLEAPAAKGRAAFERQQQQRTIESVEEPKEQLKASQEELHVQEEIRSATKGSAARKQEQPKQEPLPEPQKRLEEPQLQLVQEKSEEPSKTRFEARPQIQQQQLQQEEQQVKLAEGPLEQQRTEYDKQELVEVLDQQRKLPEPFPAALQQQQVIYQQREEDLQQQQQQTKIGAAEAEPYSFSYAVDGSSRSESGDTKGVVRGQYTLQGADGSRRIVDYIADQDGFRASINTNEFGTEARSPAAVALRSSQPSAEDITLRLEGKTRESLQQQQVAITSIQQEQQHQYKEYAAVKGAPAPLTVDAPPAPVKGLAQPLLPVLQEPEPIPAAVKRPAAAAAKKELPQQEPLKALEESNKSAEIRREPKALKGEQPSRALKETRSFESATAHRDYRPRQAAVLRQPVAQQQVRYLRPVQPQPQYQYQYQPARAYPASPVQAAGLRRYPAERNPRVSFYSSPAAAGPIDESGEHPSIGFDSRSA